MTMTTSIASSTVYQQSPTTKTPTDLFEMEYAAIIAAASPDEVASERLIAEFDRLDEDADPFLRYRAEIRCRVCDAALARFDRIRRLNTGNATLNDRQFEVWASLAKDLRDLVSVPQVLELAGLPLRKVGINARRGTAEYHSPCPICGGTDRFVSWDSPNSRGWCRREDCKWRPDSIAAVRSLIPGNEGFRDALTFLAAIAGVDTPTTEKSSTPVRSIRPPVQERRFIGGKWVA